MGEDRFHGDMSRNEVELDLNKFMDLLQEVNQLKDKVRELEVDERINPWTKWVHLAHTVDAWRIFPRLFFSTYMILLAYATIWFMGIPIPTLEQAGLISVLVGAGAAWFGQYCSTGFNAKPNIIKMTNDSS